MSTLVLPVSTKKESSETAANTFNLRLKEHLTRRNMSFEETWTGKTTTIVIKSKGTRNP
jgi:hypothetical protein